MGGGSMKLEKFGIAISIIVLYCTSALDRNVSISMSTYGFILVIIGLLIFIFADSFREKGK